VSTMLSGRPVTCSSTEVSIFDPPASQTCGAYMADYVSTAGGVVQNPGATSACRYCSLTDGDQFLAGVSIFYSERWRNFGIIFAFIGFNVFLAVLTYWLFRVANFSSLNSVFNRTKKGAKAKGAAEDIGEGVKKAAQQGAHPGERSGEKDA
jgi:ATP-binding cassette subfamily G (WHITE) protein 2 (PDR)